MLNNFKKIWWNFFAVHKELKRKKRELSMEVPPISAVVDLVMIVDYSLWSKLTNEEIRSNTNDSTVNLILYFAHLTEIVSFIFIYIFISFTFVPSEFYYLCFRSVVLFCACYFSYDSSLLPLLYNFILRLKNNQTDIII